MHIWTVQHFDLNVDIDILLYRAKRTAGPRKLHCDAHVVVENKTREPLKTKPCASLFDFRTCGYFYVFKVAIQTNSRSFVATVIT